jgi:hypothetical protein
MSEDPVEPEQHQIEQLTQQTIMVLLAQYRECSAHHLLSNTLIWQMPAVTITISGLLIAATFGYDVPDIARALVTGAGSLFVFAMTLAVERYRMLQLRRRRDMDEIEQRLAPLGARPIAWAAPQVVEQIRAGEFRVRGLYLYRLDGFNVLRALLYGTTALLFVLTVLASLDAFGLDILS